MRCLSLSWIIAGAIAGPGLAADLPVAVETAPPIATPFSWSGTYVGLNVGGAWGSFNFDPTTMNNVTGTAIDGGSTRLTDHGAIGGFQTGHNWQFGSWVLGIEHQIQFSNLKQTLTIASAVGALRPGDSFNDKIDSLNATRAKVGWAWDRLLLFTAAGLETGFVNGSASYVARPGGSPALTFSDNNTFHVGYTVGGGLDYALTDKVSVGVEYRYFDLGKQTYNLGAVTGIAAAGASTVSNDLNLRASEVMARLNMKLGNWLANWWGNR
jgi:outer membrane immunogenic protein